MAFVGELAAEIVASAGMTLGGKALSLFRRRPDTFEELSAYEQATKQAAVTSLRNDERVIEEIMELAMSGNPDMTLHRNLGRIRDRVVAIRHEMDSAPMMVYPESAIKVQDVINNVSMFHIAVVYQTFVVENKAVRLRDELEYDPDIDTKSLVGDLRTAVTALQAIWGLRPKAAINEEISKALKEQLKSVSKGVVEVIEKISESSYAQVDMAFKEVAMKKPKLFGRGAYIESLGDLMRGTIKESGKNEMSIVELRDKLLQRYPGITLKVDDMENAAKKLLERKLIHQVREEGNTQYLEIRQTGESPKCGKCGKSGGFMVDYYSCPISDGFVCDNCISFFGKCKVCGKKIKHGHELVA